ncbi:MAG: RNA 2',3'-cyclic phosphodiesterase, partial [Nocardioides sp.]
VRMFAALVPPDHVVEDLAEFLAPRQEAGTDFRWTAPEQWHVTLAFMGSVVDRNLDDLVERLGRAAARRTPLDLTIAAGGAFPNPARAKVLFAGVDANGRESDLRHLAVGARAAATKAGADAEGGRFHPHITLARIGRPEEVTRWLRVLETYRGPTWRAAEVTLIQSHLGEGPRRRPRYEVAGAFPLGRETPV